MPSLILAFLHSVFFFIYLYIKIISTDREEIINVDRESGTDRSIKSKKLKKQKNKQFFFLDSLRK